MFSYALSEPEAGSDAAAMKTKAVRTDSGYVLNGVKRCRVCQLPRPERPRRDPDRRRCWSPAGLAHFVAAQLRQGGSVSDHVYSMATL